MPRLIDLIRTRNIQAVERLLLDDVFRNEIGINLDEKDTECGPTALMCAAQLGLVEVVKRLIKHGADTSLKTYRRYRRTVLDFALYPDPDICPYSASHQAIFEMLQAPLAGKLSEIPALWLAAATNDQAKFEKFDFKVYQASSYLNCSPLAVAISNGHPEAIRWITENLGDLVNNELGFIDFSDVFMRGEMLLTWSKLCGVEAVRQKVMKRGQQNYSALEHAVQTDNIEKLNAILQLFSNKAEIVTVITDKITDGKFKGLSLLRLAVRSKAQRATQAFLDCLWAVLGAQAFEEVFRYPEDYKKNFSSVLDFVRWCGHPEMLRLYNEYSSTVVPLEQPPADVAVDQQFNPNVFGEGQDQHSFDFQGDIFCRLRAFQTMVGFLGEQHAAEEYKKQANGRIDNDLLLGLVYAGYTESLKIILAGVFLVANVITNPVQYGRFKGYNLFQLAARFGYKDMLAFFWSIITAAYQPQVCIELLQHRVAGHSVLSYLVDQDDEETLKSFFSFIKEHSSCSVEAEQPLTKIILREHYKKEDEEDQDDSKKDDYYSLFYQAIAKFRHKVLEVILDELSIKDVFNKPMIDDSFGDSPLAVYAPELAFFLKNYTALRRMLNMDRQEVVEFLLKRSEICHAEWIYGYYSILYGPLQASENINVELLQFFWELVRNSGRMQDVISFKVEKDDDSEFMFSKNSFVLPVAILDSCNNEALSTLFNYLDAAAVESLIPPIVKELRGDENLEGDDNLIYWLIEKGESIKLDLLLKFLQKHVSREVWRQTISSALEFALTADFRYIPVSFLFPGFERAKCLEKVLDYYRAELLDPEPNQELLNAIGRNLYNTLDQPELLQKRLEFCGNQAAVAIMQPQKGRSSRTNYNYESFLDLVLQEAIDVRNNNFENYLPILMHFLHVVPDQIDPSVMRFFKKFITDCYKINLTRLKTLFRFLEVGQAAKLICSLAEEVKNDDERLRLLALIICLQQADAYPVFLKTSKEVAAKLKAIKESKIKMALSYHAFISLLDEDLVSVLEFLLEKDKQLLENHLRVLENHLREGLKIYPSGPAIWTIKRYCPELSIRMPLLLKFQQFEMNLQSALVLDSKLAAQFPAELSKEIMARRLQAEYPDLPLQFCLSCVVHEQAQQASLKEHLKLVFDQICSRPLQDYRKRIGFFKVLCDESYKQQGIQQQLLIKTCLKTAIETKAKEGVSKESIVESLGAIEVNEIIDGLKGKDLTESNINEVLFRVLEIKQEEVVEDNKALYEPPSAKRTKIEDESDSMEVDTLPSPKLP